MEKYRNKVFAFLTKIPRGKVVTYGTIAQALDIPSPRLVGRILHTNTNPETYPCHRVVFSNGSLAPAYAFGGAEKQKKKLLQEGVVFSNGRVILKQCAVV